MRNKLSQKAAFFQAIRAFFYQNNVLEVSTPSLSPHCISDAFIDPFKISSTQTNTVNQWLQTSPELEMKKLLAAGSGDIYQIAHVFRDDPHTPLHQPEFMMLEWYRLNRIKFQLADEVTDLIKNLSFKLNLANSNQLSNYSITNIRFSELFAKYQLVCPHTSNLIQLQNCCQKHINLYSQPDSINDCLDLLFSHVIQPNLTGPTFWQITHYPVSMAALARINAAENFAYRFEVFVHSIELANGYWEATNSQRLRQQIHHENNKRQQQNKEPLDTGEAFYQACENLPNCSGVALGLDRLFMVLSRQKFVSLLL